MLIRPTHSLHQCCTGQGPTEHSNTVAYPAFFADVTPALCICLVFKRSTECAWEMLTLQPLLLAGHHAIRWGHVDGVLDVLQAQQLSAVWTEVVLMLGGLWLLIPML